MINKKTIYLLTYLNMAIPEDVDSFSSWWIGKSVNTDVTVIIFVDVDGVVLTNTVLHDLSINQSINQRRIFKVA